MSEATAVQMVWWTGLVLALGLTLVAGKQLVELLRTLGHLRGLADRTATAASGLADAVRRPLGLDALAEAADTVHGGASALEAAAEGMRDATTGGLSRKDRKRRGVWRHPTADPDLGEIGGPLGGLLNGGES